MSHAIQDRSSANNDPVTTRWLVEITAEAEVIPGDPTPDAEAEEQS